MITMRTTHLQTAAFAATLLLSGPAYAQPGAAVGQYVIPQAPQQMPVQQQQPISPNSVGGPATELAAPATLEQQVRELQDAVAALQTAMEQLQARVPPPGDYIVTLRSPTIGTRCDRYSLTSANDILSRAYSNSTSQYVQMPYPEGTLVMMWGNCRGQ